jgi:hypothetical protein
MAVTLYGNDSVTLTVEVPRALEGTPVLFVQARALRNPRGARVYVEVSLEGADGREQACVFPLEPIQREALVVSEVVQVQATMKPFDARNGDISDVRVDLQAWIEVR